MSIWVDELDALYDRCVTERLDITHPPTDEHGVSASSTSVTPTATCSALAKLG